MRAFLFVLLFCGAVCSKAVVPSVLEREFTVALKPNYAEKEFYQFYHILDSLEVRISFVEFGKSRLYVSNINMLVNSANNFQRALAYRFIAILRDKDFGSLMTERLESDENSFLKSLNVVAFMRTCPTKTTIAFDYLVNHENFSESTLLPFYLQMDLKSIVKTAYARLEDERPKAKVFALQTLARYCPEPSVDTVIVKALKDWDLSIKGYAIVALSVHKKGNYKPILAPYFREVALQEIIIKTLEKSHSEEDMLYAMELKRKR